MVQETLCSTKVHTLHTLTNDVQLRMYTKGAAKCPWPIARCVESNRRPIQYVFRVGFNLRTGLAGFTEDDCRRRCMCHSYVISVTWKVLPPLCAYVVGSVQPFAEVPSSRNTSYPYYGLSSCFLSGIFDWAPQRVTAYASAVTSRNGLFPSPMWPRFRADMVSDRRPQLESKSDCGYFLRIYLVL